MSLVKGKMLRLNDKFLKLRSYLPVARVLTEKLVNDCCITYDRRFFKTAITVHKEQTDDKASTKSKSKNTNLYITLIGTDGKLSTSTLEAATKLSKRRDLKLIKVSDLDQRKENPLYKLVSNAQLLGEDIQRKKQSKQRSTGFKSEKIISISHRIGDHDLHSKAQQIIKWVQKKYEVRATISGSPDNSLAESVYKKIEEELKNNGRILQKRNSGIDIKFTIIPLKEGKSDEKTSNEEVKD